ncbi:MAG TPA: hypothetical protein PLD25_09980 [Chloroflexota bacterium]|nr:hypothetical protein [Chloroflexota bacterium]
MKQHLFDHEELLESATAVSLQRQLESILRILYLALGAALTFLLFAFSDATDYLGREGFFLWFMLFLGPPAVSFLLLISPTWRLLPLRRRINPILLGFWISWLAAFIFYISALSGYGTPLWLRLLYLLLVGGYLCFILGLSFFLWRRVTTDETLFP